MGPFQPHAVGLRIRSYMYIVHVSSGGARPGQDRALPGQTWGLPGQTCLPEFPENRSSFEYVYPFFVLFDLVLIRASVAVQGPLVIKNNAFIEIV